MKGFPKDIISKFDSYKYTDERGFNAINFEDFKNNISYKLLKMRFFFFLRKIMGRNL